MTASAPPPRSNSPLPLAVGIVAIVLALVATPRRAPADDGGPDTDTGDAGAEAVPTPLTADVLPAEPTPLPKPAEWDHANPVLLARTGAAAQGCTTYRVREWLRVHCAAKTFAVSMLGGNEEGLAFWVGKDTGGEAVFPVRRGDRRVIQLWVPGFDPRGQFAAKALLVIQEQWVDGESGPIVTAM